MSFALSSFRKDIARWRQDWVLTLIWIAIPLMVGTLVTILMGSDVKPSGTLLLVDEDETFFSELVVGAYSAGELGEFLTVEKTDYDDGLTRVNDGEASGLLVIPKGFAEAFLEAEPVTLTLRTNPSQTILPGIIREVTEILLDAGFYAQQLFSDEIETLTSMSENPTDAQVAAIAIAIQNKVEVVAPRLFPLVIDVEIVEPPQEQPAPPLALLYMPGVIVMALVFSANGLAGDFWKERELGTLRRLVAAPTFLGEFLAGKALAAALIIAIVGGITLFLGFLYHGIGWAHYPVSLLWLVVSGVALFAWFSVLQMLFSNQKTAGVVSTLLVFPLLMAGGSFFPLAVMPGWIAAIGRASPNGFMAERLTTEITSVAAGAIDASSWAIVVISTVVGFGICGWRLRTGFARA
ncbi:MAG: ABC transporter permease [Woeseiaceae bacterium]|nr:ABC transporter permease [Woeseiaceae bacterium]